MATCSRGFVSVSRSFGANAALASDDLEDDPHQAGIQAFPPSESSGGPSRPSLARIGYFIARLEQLSDAGQIRRVPTAPAPYRYGERGERLWRRRAGAAGRSLVRCRSYGSHYPCQVFFPRQTAKPFRCRLSLNMLDVAARPSAHLFI
jgi:hypothetical protein